MIDKADSEIPPNKKLKLDEQEELKSSIDSPSRVKNYLRPEEEFEIGDKVAALVSGDTFWILASVVKNVKKNIYEIADEDTGDDDNQVRK